MKIGAAISGNGVGSVAGIGALYQLKQLGIFPDFLSVTGFAGFGALSFSGGADQTDAIQILSSIIHEAYSAKWFRGRELDRLIRRIDLDREYSPPVILNAFDLNGAEVIGVSTSGYQIAGNTVEEAQIPMEDILKGSIAMNGRLRRPCRSGGFRLIDAAFSEPVCVRQLLLSGCDRIIELRCRQKDTAGAEGISSRLYQIASEKSGKSRWIQDTALIEIEAASEDVTELIRLGAQAVKENEMLIYNRMFFDS